MKMEFSFAGKAVLVTGAGRGIGRGIALALSKTGCKVYALDKDKAPLDKLVSENGNIVPIQQNLENWDETKATLEQLETLDGLVNNAGIVSQLYSALDHTKEDLQKYVDIDLFSYINCIQVIAKKMIASGRKGSIVNISSIIALNAWPNLLGYAMAKAGVDAVTKQFALELGPHNIRVNSVNPTRVNTELIQALPPEMSGLHLTTDRTPMGRAAEVEDIVGPVLYLLSDHSGMVTGTLNPVDGGLMSNITINAV